MTPSHDKLTLPTPGEMIRHLDRFVRGQERAKRDLATAVYNHYFSQGHRELFGEDLGRHHLLLIGPTGVGKTLMVKTLAEFLQVPVGFASATSLVEVGYKGTPVESVVAALLAKVDGDARKAEKGIIFIDEIDKIRRRDVGGSRDVSGEGVQNALLTLLDGRVSRGPDGQDHAAVDTSRILFVCSGAFVGLDEIVETRLGTGSGRLGFHAMETEEAIPRRRVFEALCQADTADLVKFGMIPEFIGRFACVSVLHELGREDLRAIVGAETERSALAMQQAMAKAHGIELVLGDDLLKAIATEAEELGTGARGLHRLVGKALDAVDYRWPELADEGVSRVVLGAECLLGNCDPVLEKCEVGERIDEELREGCLAGLPPRPRPEEETSERLFPEGVTDPTGLKESQIRKLISKVRNKIGADEATGSARKWWEAFEAENDHRPALILRLCEELAVRRATVSEFFLSYVYSNTDNIQANLHYLDYQRLKKQE